MADATQSHADFKGDHLSAHMGFALGETRYVIDAAMTATSANVSSATANFLSSDIGKTAIVLGAGASGAALVTTVASITSTTVAVLSAVASTTVSSARCVIGTNETAGILSLVTVPNIIVDPLTGGTGGGTQRLIPTGNYLITPGDLLIPNPQSGLLAGQGSRFNTVLMSADPNSTSPILTLGDNTWEPHNYEVRNLSIDGNYGAPAGALFFNKANWMGMYGVTVQSLAAGSVGIASNSTPVLFGEVQFFRCSVYSGDGGVPNNSTAVLLYPTGNIEFYGCNLENLTYGCIIHGQNQGRFIFFGGHLERIGSHAFILHNVQPTIDTESIVGDVWLGNDVVGGLIRLSYSSGAWSSGAIVDNGFGNKITRLSSQLQIPGDKAAYSAGLDFRGDEWLQVENLNDDPTFLNDDDDWTAGASAVLDSSGISMPGVKAGKSLLIYSAAGGGYAEREFTAEANTDYLLQVGILTRSTENYKIVVADSSGTVWDSGSFTYGVSVAEYQSFKVIRKSIPITSDTQFTVRIYSMDAGQTTIIPLVLISKSQIQMENDFATVGAGLTETGTGITYAWEQDGNTGKVYSVNGVSVTARCFVRAVVSLDVGKTGQIGITGDGNDPAAGPIVNLLEGEDIEYIIPLASWPNFAQVVFYSFFSGTNVITIKEVGLYPINDVADTVQRLTDGWMRSDRANGTNELSVHQSQLWLGSNFNSNWQAAASSGNAFTRCVYASNIFWNEAGGTWTVPNNGAGDWSAILMLNSGELGFACEAGLTLPTTRTNAQVLAAIKIKIPTGDPTQFLTGTLDLIAGGIQVGLRISSGDPNGVVSALMGMLCLDDTGKLWVKASGGFSNTGWDLVASGILQGSGSPEGVVTATQGKLYLNTAGAVGELLWEKASGSGNTGWISNGGDIWFPSNSPTNTEFRANKKIGLNKAVGTGLDLDINGNQNIDGTLKMNALTASRPLKLTSGKLLTAALIDVNSTNDISATGFSANDVPVWDSTKFVPVAGVSASFTEITAGPFGDTFVKTVALSGTIPAGLTLTVTTDTALTGFTMDTHTSVNGVVNS